MTDDLTALEQRVAALERHIKQMLQVCEDLRREQGVAAAAVLAAAEVAKESLRTEAESVREQLRKQSEAVLAISQALIKLQQTIQRYGAAGTLAGAVALYIIAKVAGL